MKVLRRTIKVRTWFAPILAAFLVGMHEVAGIGGGRAEAPARPRRAVGETNSNTEVRVLRRTIKVYLWIALLLVVLVGQVRDLAGTGVHQQTRNPRS